MAQNIFMTSMYFFVPINKVNWCKIGGRIGEWNTIKCPSIFQNISATCSYAAVSNYNQSFYYNALLGNSCLKERRVKLYVYLLQYVLKIKKKKEICYFLAIGTGIDKYFDVVSSGMGSIDLCDDMDIVMLKRAFYSENDRCQEKTGLYYPKNDPVDFHREWLERVIGDFDQVPNVNPAFDASISIIRAIHDSSSINPLTPDNIDLAFNHNYYDVPCNSYDKVLCVDTNRFAYGVTEGNENYVKLPDDLIHRFVDNSYSNNYSERFFSTPDRLTFLCTHYPYVNLQEEQNCKLNMNITDVDGRMIYELCHCLFLKKELKEVQSKMDGKHNSGEVKTANDRLKRLIKVRLFNMTEADNRLLSLFHGLGVSNEYEETKSDVDSYLKSKQFKYSKRQGWTSIIIGVISIAATIFTALILNQRVSDWLIEKKVTVNGVEYRIITFFFLIITFMFYFIWIEYLAITDKILKWALIKNWIGKLWNKGNQ